MAEKKSVAEVRKILGKRRTSTGVQYLVKWKGRGQQKEYWVPFRHLQQSVDLVKAYNQSNKILQNGSTPSADQAKAPSNKGARKPARSKSFPPSSKNIMGNSTASQEMSPEIAVESNGVLNLGLPTSPIMESVMKGMDKSGGTSPPKQKRKYVRKVDKQIASQPDKKTAEGSPPVNQQANGDVNFSALSGPQTKYNVIGVLKSIDPSNQDVCPKPKRKYVRKVLKESHKGSDLSYRDVKEKIKKSRPLGKPALKSGIRTAGTGQPKMPTTRKNMNKLVKKSILIQQRSNQGKASQDVSKGHSKDDENMDTNTKDIPPNQKKEKIVKGCKRKIVKNSSGKTMKVSGSLFSHVKSESNQSNSTSDSEGMLYSLVDADVSSSDEDLIPVKKQKLSPSHQKRKSPKLMSKKKLVLRIKDLKHEWPEASTTTNTPDSDPEVTFKISPRKMLLKDSIRPKPDKQDFPVKSPVASGHSQSTRLTEPLLNNPAAPATCTTPPRPTNQPADREPSPSLASTNDVPRVPPSIPILPNSPAAPRYEVLIKNMTTHNSGKGQRRTDTDKEPVERRVSVRHSESAYKYKEIVVKKSQNFTQIWLFSQTKRKNALNPKVFQELIQALHNAKFDDSRVVLLAGSGRVFCSGIDLHYLSNSTVDKRVSARQMADSLKEFVNALISFPKPIVAAVNGPAVGLGVAILPLCDIIYASDKASFYCPYTKLGQTPEGCASYTFPHAMGLAMANELLLSGRKITALEAYQIGLVSHVFWPTSMMQEVIPRMQQMASSSAKALEATKVLIRSHVHSKLQMSADTECLMLAELWASAECQRAITAYMEEDEDMML